MSTEPLKDNENVPTITRRIKARVCEKREELQKKEVKRERQ